VRLNFLKIAPIDRRQYFEEGSSQRNLSPVMLEKDFWVCWMLAVLFNSTLGKSLVFKGGTSLSKVFRIIGRFSEDIDLSLSPAFCGIQEEEMDEASSRNQRTAWMQKLQSTCVAKVRDTVRPETERIVVESLGQRSDGKKWLELEVDHSTKSPSLLFHYPTTQPTGFAYLLRSVKLEFGSLTDQRPTGSHPVVPWIAEVFPQAFDDWRCDVIALEVERTFWEKATILHVESHRPTEKATPNRFSRHYADTAAMALNDVAHSALEAAELRDRVVSWKSRFFASSWAKYELAKPGTFRLVPPADRIPNLVRDYRAMRDMYFSDPVQFDKILEILADLEQRINRG
jgi:hypothetical protein